jgi:excisionase family DNA binding protein
LGGTVSAILTVEQAAELLQIKRRTAYRLASRRELPAKRVGRTFQFLRYQLFQFVRNEPITPWPIDRTRPLTHTERRRNALRLATPFWADRFLIEKIYFVCRRLTALTGVEHHVDHIVPLQNPKVCGLHVHYNLKIMTAAQNRTKYNALEQQ